MLQFVYPDNFVPGYCAGDCLLPLPRGGWLVNGVMDSKGVRLLVSPNGKHTIVRDNFVNHCGLLCNSGVENYYLGEDGCRSDLGVRYSCFSSSDKFDLLALGYPGTKGVSDWIRRIYDSGEKDVLVVFYCYESKLSRGLSFGDLFFRHVYSSRLSYDGLSCIVLGSGGGGCIIDNPLL
jgi:hypothetical protein